MADVPRRVELGFEGGQVIAVRIPQSELDALRKALGGDGWHLLKTEEDEVDVNLADLVFLRTAGDGQKVGF
jgi:hypothetical protein